jgi:hypothetical protein
MNIHMNIQREFIIMDNENVKDHERLFSNREISTWTI